MMLACCSRTPGLRSCPPTRPAAVDASVCIGDAAHAMSPIGGVGINLAIQDAVAAANLLWRVLASLDPGSSPG